MRSFFFVYSILSKTLVVKSSTVCEYFSHFIFNIIFQRKTTLNWDQVGKNESERKNSHFFTEFSLHFPKERCCYETSSSFYLWFDPDGIPLLYFEQNGWTFWVSLKYFGSFWNLLLRRWKIKKGQSLTHNNFAEFVMDMCLAHVN
jgi:hypothetical protein